jgi:hypothetical protein
MTSTFAESVRSSSANLSLRELLEQPVTELLGVGEEAATALQSIDVQTIFDLGSSATFAQASSALAAASSDLGLLASDVLDADGSPVPVSEVPNLPLDRLQDITEAVATALTSALDAPTIRDLALWPPRQVAHELVTIAAGTDLGDTAEERAEELRPALGEYPTERVYYDTLVMLGTEPPQNQTPLAQPLSLEQLAVAGLSFGAPAVGALATYSQSWFAQAVTLGHMVHSLALAPGEATRVAVLDWSRRTTATATESIEEREQLDNSMNHARAVSEVQNSVANEMQSGGSISTGWARSTSSAWGVAGSIGGGVAGVVGDFTGVLGFGGGGSKSSQESETESRATSASWSRGSRSVMAEMNQRVNDRTEQHATSVRNRRASAVREVSETEHEQVSTRIVANYNHMHALTVQYYEVVQIYRVSVQLNNFVRALFLPFELLDFSAAHAADIVARFRGQLLAAALTPRAAELLLDDRGRIEVRSGVRIAFPISVGTLAGASLSAAPTRVTMRAAETGEGPRLARRAAESGEGPAGGGGGGGSAGAGGDGGATGADGTSGATDDRPAHTAPRPGFQFAIVRPGPVVEVIPGDARLVSIAFEDVGIDRVRVDQPGVGADTSTFVVPGATNQVDFPRGIPLRRIDSIHVARDGGTVSDGSMAMHYQSDGRESIAVVPLSLVEGTAMQKVAFLTGDAADRRAELLAHLQANRSYYTRAVLERLDAASLVLLLSGISWLGKPLADQVEPNPIAVTGNFLVLRAPAEAGDPSGVAGFQTWRDLLRDRDIDFKKQDTRLVPIPTGGVFAEAVLGRSNSAEKLDITRFWNWQDSPIPLQPPEIAPVGTETRALPEDLRPGQLGAPILNIQPPTPLPEPAGLTAALGALASANLFRDMSGLAGTQAAAQAASAGTLTAATEAGRIASANYQAATNQATEMGKAAADMWKVLKASEKSGESGGSGKQSTGGVSAQGARVNQGRDMDRRGLTGRGGGAAEGSGGAAPTTPTDTQPTSAAWGDVMPGPNSFSREVAYSDESAAVSPDMVGATTAALEVPIIPASAGAGVPIIPASAGAGPIAPSLDLDFDKSLLGWSDLLRVVPQPLRDQLEERFARGREEWLANNTPLRGRFPDEPSTNIDGLEVPPWVDQAKVFQSLEDHYNAQHAALTAADLAQPFSRLPGQILGANQAVPVTANYFVLHDTADTAERRDGAAPADANLYIGTVSLARSLDWHDAGNATKLEFGGTTCFVHTELTRATGGSITNASPDSYPNQGISTFRAAGTRYTDQQYDDLANAYIVASIRRGRFLTVTAHKEVDRSAALRGSPNTAGHNDPEDFDLGHLYELVNRKLGMPLGTTYGITQERMNTPNQRQQVNEFIEYARGNVAAANQYGRVRWQTQDPTAPQGDAPSPPYGAPSMSLYLFPVHDAAGNPVLNCGDGTWEAGPPSGFSGGWWL